MYHAQLYMTRVTGKVKMGAKCGPPSYLAIIEECNEMKLLWNYYKITPHYYEIM